MQLWTVANAQSDTLPCRRQRHVCASAGTVECFDPFKGANEQTAKQGELWDYQYCTEQFMPMSRNGIDDIYWDEPWNDTAARQACMDEWQVKPRPYWGTIQWGGKDLSTLTNVVFSNGLYDPWHLGGVLQDMSDSVKVQHQHNVSCDC